MMYLSSKKYAKVIPIAPNDVMRINSQLRRLHEANCTGQFVEQSSTEYSEPTAAMFANYMKTDRQLQYSHDLYEVASKGSFSVIRK